MKKCIFFDLDGTLTDSGEGIMKCAQTVFEHFGMQAPDRRELRSFVGPPLYKSFEKFGIPNDKIDEAIKVYRKRYNTVGKFENRPYDNIEILLSKLKNDGHRLFIATAKPQTVSVEILRHFGLYEYFECICGAGDDGTRREKHQVIQHLMQSCQNLDNIVMVGDTMSDVEGARICKIPVIAVLWGYGDRNELIKNADLTAEAIEGLYAVLSK